MIYFNNKIHYNFRVVEHFIKGTPFIFVMCPDEMKKTEVMILKFPKYNLLVYQEEQKTK